MTNDEKQSKAEKKGYKFQFVHSSATQHLRTAPVILSKNGRHIGKYTCLTNALKDAK
jgi:hypothetical protein